MTSASTKRWRRKGNEVVEAGRNGRRVLMAVSLYPSDTESLELAASAPDLKREVERLRAAMVYAMDDCELALGSQTLRGVALNLVSDARKILKAALETE